MHDMHIIRWEILFQIYSDQNFWNLMVFGQTLMEINGSQMKIRGNCWEWMVSGPELVKVNGN